jgi:hypothetical protein
MAVKRGNGRDTCKFCGSDSLWGNFFNREGLGTDGRDGSPWDLLCPDCGKFQIRRNPKIGP